MVEEIVSTNITPRVISEQELKEIENRYKSMFHKNGSYMLLVDPADGLIVDINEAARDFLKLEKSENKKRYIHEFWLISKAQIRKLKQQVLRDKRIKSNFKCRLANGEQRDLEVNSGIVEIDNKSLIYAILHDVSKYKKAEKEIVLTNKRLKSILAISEYGAPHMRGLIEYVLDEVLRFTKSDNACFFTVNSAEASFVLEGCRSDHMDLCKKDIGDKLLFEKRPGLINVLNKQRGVIRKNLQRYPDLQEVFGKGLRNCMIVTIKERDKLVAFVNVARNSKSYEAHELRQLNLMMRNVWQIIEKQRSRDELEIAKVKAEESDRLKSAFLANMSHEIRTPLNAIVGFSNLLTSDEMSSTERMKFGEIIERNSEQLLTLIDDIIDIAKLEGHQLSLKPILVKVNDVIRHVEMNYIELMKRADKENIKLIAHYSEKDVDCYIDNYRFNQIFFNLIGNAIKFTKDGSIDFGLFETRGKSFVFFVKDTGIGIERSRQNAIFGEFVQENEDIAPKFGGTGLGLTITKRLVEMMNGEIWIESEKGKGATFYFTIPAEVQMELPLE